MALKHKGMFWIDDIGWIGMEDYLRKQWVVEAKIGNGAGFGRCEFPG